MITHWCQLAALMLVTTLAATATAQVYRSTDEHGNPVFTDRPPTDRPAQEVELGPTNSAQPPPTVTRRKTPDRQGLPRKPDVTITAPENETTIPMGPGNFTVSARAEPGLDSGESLLLLLDGNPVGAPQKSNSWRLTNVYRGAHDLRVQRLDRDGKTTASSEAIRVYVLRPSVR